MNIIDAIQGSPEWLAARAKHFTASEAPAMMGASKYQTRAELLRQKHTGIAADVDANTQRLFDRGHAAEAAARPIVEGVIGAELFPATGALEVDGLPLLASFDGITMLEDRCWENKLWNAALADAVRAEQLEPHYYWQLEQQLLVSGAERVYFTTSDGTPENTVGMWYEAVPGRREQLIAGWKQFVADLSEYQHVETAPAPVAAVIEDLPALFVQVEGKVLATNLDAFKAKAGEFIASIKTELVTDQDFADADKMVGFLKGGEEKLALAKQQALAQTASIDELFRAVDAISAQMRDKRLALEKLVTKEKENRKAAIITKARQAIDDHIAGLNRRIGGNWMPQASAQPYADAIKGKRSLTSMQDAVDTALAHAKIEANDIADRIEENRMQLAGEAHDFMFLFPDFAQVCTKTPEDFALLVGARIAAEEKRKEAEREAIRQQEVAKQRLRDAITANNQTQFEAAALEQAATGTGVLKVSSDCVEHVPIAAFAEKIEAGESMIDDFIRLLPISVAEKKALRINILKWEKYRVAKLMLEAA